MVGLALGLVGALVIALFTASARKTVKANQERIKAWSNLDVSGVKRGLDLLLTRGYQGAFAIFEHKETARFVQFLKYVDEHGNVGLETHFPRAEWSAAFYLEVVDLLRRRGIEFERHAVDRQIVPDPQVVEFIYVDFAADTELAADVAATIARDIFKLGPAGLSMTADGICVFDRETEIIDYPMPKYFPVGHPKRRKRVPPTIAKPFL